MGLKHPLAHKFITELIFYAATYMNLFAIYELVCHTELAATYLLVI